MLLREETEENKKSLKIATYICSILKYPYVVNRSQDLEKEKEETFKNLDLVAAQCNGIAACAYSLKISTAHTLLYLPYCTYGL